jgi:hypothetical protein
MGFPFIQAYRRTPVFCKQWWCGFYISLGQLPGNPWAIVPGDKSAYNFAKAYNEKNPYTPNADKLLRSEFLRLITNNPGAYAKKCGYNLLKIFTGGVYTGEYATIFTGSIKRNEADSIINSTPGIINKFKIISSFPSDVSRPLYFEKIIQALFIVVFFVFLLTYIFLFFIRKSESFKMLFALFSGLILYKFIIIALIQYEYRHLNTIYLFLLGTFLIFVMYIKDKRKSLRKL